MDGFIFGLVDNSVLLLCMYTGISIDQWIEGKTKGLLGAVLGATIGNMLSDSIGAIIDPTMRASLYGISLGCLIPILLIPLIEKYRSYRGSTG